jgi:hypothetical protein
MTTPKHVLPRDGSQGFGLSEPPQPAPKPSAPHEAESGSASFGKSYGDRSTVGVYDERKAFEGAAGAPSPRQRAMRGESGFGEHVTPDRSEELISKPVPLT